ncbi:DNA-3-methyladenine glycosylase I [Pleionea sp. CnH1-48]|uniref:DNA-3-methyladenine glycosylase I n=1 Tax=Pleionea sp. CnH1-48 TaxID=2954494 RepID=UPI0020974418|nr:DNA-3-methyladenine glycosylase I [Pleionea sp. CnH1-48]MCO7226369.1 DNA-3-methyladenine glycosylase I [Pleionea sp. CnH1-48]
MKAESFDTIYQRAAERKGGESSLEHLLDKPLDNKLLSKIPDHRYLSEFTKKIFQSGFVWRVVENKWENFERVFFDFDIKKLLMMPPDMIERKASDPDIIRNLRKVKSIQNNALFIDDINKAEGSFGEWIAKWPEDSIVELWLLLKKRGDRLGGNTGPYSLRTLGKDTFLLTRDVEAYFRNHKLIDGGLTAKRTLHQIQDVFNQWRAESDRSLQELSLLVAYGIGDNRV